MSDSIEKMVGDIQNLALNLLHANLNDCNGLLHSEERARRVDTALRTAELILKIQEIRT